MSKTIKLNPNLPAKVSDGSWIIALLCTTIALIVFFITVVIFKQSTHTALVSLLSDELTVGNLGAANNTLERLNEQPSGILLLLGAEETLDDTRRYQVDLTMKALELLTEKKTEKAYTLVTSQLTVQQKSTFEEVLKKEALLYSEKRELNSRKQDLKDTLLEYSLLAQDFSDLIGSSPVEKEDGRPNPYDSGLLAGMPKLKGLPNDISELADLGPYIKYMRGNLDSDDVASFRTDFDRIKESGTKLLQEYDHARDALELKSSTILSLSRSLNSSRAELRSLLRSLLIEKYRA